MYVVIALNSMLVDRMKSLYISKHKVKQDYSVPRNSYYNLIKCLCSFVFCWRNNIILLTHNFQQTSRNILIYREKLIYNINVNNIDIAMIHIL